MPAATSLDNDALRYNYALETFAASNVTAIGANALSSCTTLRSVDLPALGSVGAGAFYLCQNLSAAGPFTNWLSTVGATCFNNCNLPYAAITNIALNLPARADMQTINMLVNPGSAAAKAWYFSGSVSNDLHSRNWKLAL